MKKGTKVTSTKPVYANGDPPNSDPPGTVIGVIVGARRGNFLVKWEGTANRTGWHMPFHLKRA